MAFPTTPLDITIELALGANLYADPSTWVWTDVTDYVYVRDGITIVRGRADGVGETPPSTCNLTVDNRDGRWSPTNPTGAWYGQLTKNTPIRIKTSEVFEVVRWTGFLSAFPPRWDLSEEDRYVPITASGILQRLGRGQTPFRSPLVRAITSPFTIGTHTNVTPVSYWPGEDGSEATTLAEFYGGKPIRRTAGTLTPATEGPDGSSPLPEFTSSAAIEATVAPYTNNLAWTVGFLVKVPASPTQTVVLLRWLTTGTYPTWQVVLAPATPDTLGIQAYDTAGAIQINDSMNFTRNSIEQVDFWVYIVVTAEQNGTSVDYQLLLRDADGSSGTVVLTEAGITAGKVRRLTVPSDFRIDGTLMGHWAVWDQVSTTFPWVFSDPAINGHTGETVSGRLNRLGLEVPPIEGAIYDFGPSLSEEVTLGPQPQDTYLTIVNEAVAADAGHLTEIRDPATFDKFVGYEYSDNTTNVDTELVLDHDSGHLSEPFEPTDDDQNIRNDVTVTRSSANGSGSSARVIATEAEFSRLTPGNIGTYDDTADVNVDSDEQLIDQAGWRVNFGTVEGLRIPVVSLNLAANPDLIDAWLRCEISDRITITNPPAGIAPDDIDLIIEGYTETFGPYDWTVQINCTPYQPWRVFTLATDTACGVHEFDETPDNGNEDAGAATNRGVSLGFRNPGTVRAIAFYAPATNSGTYTVGLYRVDTDDIADAGTGTLLASASISSALITTSAWNMVPITATEVDTFHVYRAVVHSSSGRYVSTASFWDADIATGPVVGFEASSDPVINGHFIYDDVAEIYNGAFLNNAALAYPNDDGAQTNYYVDVVFTSDHLGRLAQDEKCALRQAIDEDDLSMVVDANRTCWTTRHVQDDFGRSASSGWGTADYPATAWSVLSGGAAQFSVSGGKGLIACETVAALRSISLSVTHYSIDGTVDMLIPVTPASAGIYGMFVMRRQDATNFYYGRVEVTTASAVQVAIRKVVGGVDSSVAAATTVSGLTHSTTVPLRLRCSIQGTSLAIKAWLSNADEPASWHATATDTSLESGSGIALSSQLLTGNTNSLPVTVQWDRLHVVASPGSNVDDFPLNARLGGEVVTVSGIANTPPVYIAVGAASHTDNAAVTPALFAGNATRHLIVVVAAIRSSGTGTLATPGGYTRMELFEEEDNIQVYAKVHDGSESDPTITPSGGASGDTVSALTFGLGNMPNSLTDLNDLIVGKVVQLNTSAQNISYGGLWTPRVPYCVDLIVGWKQDDYTSVAVPTGYTELIEASSTTGNDQSLYVAYRLNGPVPAVTPDTSLAVTGGASAISRSAVFALAGGTQTFTLSARSVNGVVKSHAVGTRVEVEHASVLAHAAANLDYV